MDGAIEFSERWRSRLLAAQTDLIDAYGGSKRVVEKLSMSRSQVGRWYGGADRDTMPLPIVMALEGYVRRPIVTAIMAEFLGLEVACDGDRASMLACLSSLNAELVETSGKMMAETVRAKADGVVTPAEAQQLRALSRRIERIRADIDDQLARATVREGDV